MGNSLFCCSNDWTYDPIQESPAAYVVLRRREAIVQMVNQMAIDDAVDDGVNTDEMTAQELRDYYDKKAKRALTKMNGDQQQAMFKRFTDEEQKKRQKQIQLQAKKQADIAKRNKGLRNVAPKARDFKSKLDQSRNRGSVQRRSNDFNSTVILNRSKSSDGSDDNDVSIQRLDDSVSDMVSVGGQSMAGISDTSGGGVRKVTSGTSDNDTSMMSGGDVQVVKAAGPDVSTDDINMSMAGLSDMSMGEINRVATGNDSMADYSMASLNNDDSMAGVNEDSGYNFSTAKKPSSQIKEESSDTSNLLDDLKIEFSQEEQAQANPQGTDHSLIKQQELKDKYQQSTVFDEDEEYESDSDDNDGPTTRASGKRKSMRASIPKQAVKLSDLAKKQTKYAVDDAIEERTQTQESMNSPESGARQQRLSESPDNDVSGLRMSTDDSTGNKMGFAIKLRQDKDIVSSSSSDEDDDDESGEDNVKHVAKSDSDEEDASHNAEEIKDHTEDADEQAVEVE